MAEEVKELSKEYPKALYPKGDRAGEPRTVQDADEERAARKDGFRMLDAENDKASVERLAEPKPVETKAKKK